MQLQLNNFTQKLDFDILWFRRRVHKIQKKKGKKGEKKKEKVKKPHRRQKWVGWDERVSKKYDRVKYFCRT